MKKYFVLFLISASFLYALKNQTGFEERMKQMGLLNIQNLSQTILVDLKYSSEDNFMKKDVYGDLNQCFLRKEAAEKLIIAENYLKSLNKELNLLVYDCARPRSVQYLMWELVKNTPQQIYVAHPQSGSIHNYGQAVDLTLADENGNPLDMGTPFDYFGDLAQPKYEKKFLKEGKLTQKQIENRKILRKVMVKAGFKGISNEWWHFDAFSRAMVKKINKIIE